MRLALLASLFIFLTGGLWAQTSTAPDMCVTGTIPDSHGVSRSIDSSCTNSQTITTSGGSITIDNRLHGAITSFEEKITGSPSTISVVIRGCMRGGTCDVLDTNSNIANDIRSPSVSKAYDYYKVTATWTGGTNVSVGINTSVAQGPLPPSAVLAAALQGTTSDGNGGLRTGSVGAGVTCPAGAPAGSICSAGKYYQNGQEFTGGGSATLVVTVFTSDSTLTATQMQKGVFTNMGASGQVNLTLGSAQCTVGQAFTVYLTSAQPIKLIPYTGDQIFILTSSVNHSITSDSVVGSFVSLSCLAAGKWYLTGLNGSWTDTN